MRLTARAAIKDGKASKRYTLVNGVPKDMRPSAGRTILVSIARHRGAEADTIRRDMKRGFSDATLRFYLGKFQREGVVTAVSVITA